MKHFALDGSALEDSTLDGVKLIESRGQQRLQCGRDDHVRSRITDDREHLQHKQWIASGRTSDLLPQVGICRLRPSKLSCPHDGQAATSSSRGLHRYERKPTRP